MRASAYREWSVQPAPDEPPAWSAAYPMERVSHPLAAAALASREPRCAEAPGEFPAAARSPALVAAAAALRARPALPARLSQAEAPAARSPRRCAEAASVLRAQEDPAQPWPEPSCTRPPGLHRRSTRAQGRF